MKKQINIISNHENLQTVELSREVNGQSIHVYRSPKILDLGEASKLLQGGGYTGRDNHWQTHY